jgi:hypothetical protein
MKRFILWIPGLMFLLSAAVGEQGVQEKKGIVTYIDGQVKRKASSVEEWTSAPVNTEILSGDRVRTFLDSRAELDLAQLDIIRLAPRTEVDIIRLYEETREKQVATQIHLAEGEIWGSIGKIETGTEFDVSAPIAAAAITGTVFRLKVETDSTTQLKVYSGEVQITNTMEKKEPTTIDSPVPRQIEGPRQIAPPHEVSVEEWMVIIQSMQQITIDKLGRIISQGSFSHKDRDEKDKWVLWNKKRDEKRLIRLQEE